MRALPRTITARPLTERLYLEAPTGGWDPDDTPWGMPSNRAPVLDNALIRSGNISPRGALVNWADLSVDFPLNLTGVQPLYGSTKLAIGRKTVSAASYVDPWFAPIVRPATTTLLGIPGGSLVASGGTTISVGPAAVPGPRGINFEGTRLCLTYGGTGTPVLDASGTYYGQSTLICALSSAGVSTTYANAPTGALDIKGYQSRIWCLGGISSLGSSAALGTGTFNPITIYFSNPLTPGGGNSASYADWKDPISGALNYITMDGDTTDPGVALATIRGSLIILRYNSTWILRGSTPQSYSLSPISRDVGCIDARSVVETDHGVYFIGNGGLFLTNGTSVTNLSGPVTRTLQNAIQVVVASIRSGFGGYITACVTSDSQILVSMGIASVTSGAPDGHIQPVWCGLYNPFQGAWTRITSALFAGDGNIVVPGNNYPGWVMNTPDQRLISVGDKYVTQWESEFASTNVTTFNVANRPTAATNDASVGSVPWTNPANAEVADGVYATAALTEASAAGTTSTAPTQTSTGNTAWSQLPAPANSIWTGYPTTAPTVSLPNGATSETMLLTGFNFAVPATAKIMGFSIQPQGQGSAAMHAKLIKGGVVSGTDFGTATLGSAPTWTLSSSQANGQISGTSFTPADVNASNFGVAFWFVNGFGATNSQIFSRISVSCFYTDGSEILKTTSYGFAIPSTATITGIQVSTTVLSLVGNILDDAIQLYKAGVLQATNRSARAVWGTTPTTLTYGGPSDLWGTTWTPSDINNAGFGVGISPQDWMWNSSTRNDTAQVDVVTITVYYTIANNTRQQSFTQNPSLYDLDQAGNYQPIPFLWLTRMLPTISTTQRSYAQMKRWYMDYVFQGVGLPNPNGFTVTMQDANRNTIAGTSPTNVPIINNSLSSGSVTGGQQVASQVIQRFSHDAEPEFTDAWFQVAWTDVQRTSQPSAVVEIYGLGVEGLAGRDLTG